MAKWAVVVAVVCWWPGPVVSASGPQFSERVRVPSGLLRTLVIDAIRGAAARLASPKCAEVLVHFRDDRGRTLLERLQELERGPVAFLSEIWFVDAGLERTCLLNEIAAYTRPGTRVVFVCSSRFASPIHSLRGRSGELVIIHEMLHALGLGEDGNHPGSREITRRLTESCG